MILVAWIALALAVIDTAIIGSALAALLWVLRRPQLAAVGGLGAIASVLTPPPTVDGADLSQYTAPEE